MFTNTVTLAALQGGDGSIAGLAGFVFSLAITAVIIAGIWKVFVKAGKPGWAALIPIYNLYVMIKISGNDWWWLILFFIPVINIFAFAKISIDVADQFDQGLLFGVGLWLLGFVFFPLLGFGDYRYKGTAA